MEKNMITIKPPISLDLDKVTDKVTLRPNSGLVLRPNTSNDDMLDGGEFDDVVVTGQDLRWKKWAVAIGAVALVWFLAIQK